MAPQDGREEGTSAAGGSGGEKEIHRSTPYGELIQYHNRATSFDDYAREESEKGPFVDWEEMTWRSSGRVPSHVLLCEAKQQLLQSEPDTTPVMPHITVSVSESDLEAARLCRARLLKYPDHYAYRRSERCRPSIMGSGVGGYSDMPSFSSQRYLAVQVSCFSC